MEKTNKYATAEWVAYANFHNQRAYNNGVRTFKEEGLIQKITKLFKARR